MMGRSFGKLLSRIWDDEEFLALEVGPQRLYGFLVSQSNINHAGLLPLTMKKWSKKAKNLTISQVEQDLAVLDQTRFIVLDEDTEELLVRTYIRNDDIWKAPRMMGAAVSGAQEIESRRLRRALLTEVDRIPVHELSDEPTKDRAGRPAPSIRAQVQGHIDNLHRMFADLLPASGAPSGPPSPAPSRRPSLAPSGSAWLPPSGEGSASPSRPGSRPPSAGGSTAPAEGGSDAPAEPPPQLPAEPPTEGASEGGPQGGAQGDGDPPPEGGNEGAPEPPAEGGRQGPPKGGDQGGRQGAYARRRGPAPTRVTPTPTPTPSSSPPQATNSLGYPQPSGGSDSAPPPLPPYEDLLDDESPRLRAYAQARQILDPLPDRDARIAASRQHLIESGVTLPSITRATIDAADLWQAEQQLKQQPEQQPPPDTTDPKENSG